MTRYHAALRTADDADLEIIAGGLLDAVREVKAEGLKPEGDPAVMLYGARIAFVTHADMATEHMYRQLVDVCEARHRLAVSGQFGARQ